MAIYFDIRTVTLKLSFLRCYYSLHCTVTFVLDKNKYKLRDDGKGCQVKDLEITLNYEECKEALQIFSKITSGNEIIYSENNKQTNWNTLPKGCFYDTSDKAYFNESINE